MTKALGPEVLLAYAMNGEPLEAKPWRTARVVVPGYAGVRSPKWLYTITVQDSPSDNPMQANDYKLFPPHVLKATSDPRLGLTINAMPVNSAICEPAPHARLCRACPDPGLRHGQRSFHRPRRPVRQRRSHVTAAELDETPGAPWASTFWTATIDLPPGEHELAVRAWDAAGQTQPALSDDTWNFKGYLSAAWHRISVVVA